MAETLVIISHYGQRPRAPLERLLDSLSRWPAGAPFDVALVVNEDAPGPARSAGEMGVKFVHARENTGMNIGAWEHGWHVHPEYAHYLFLQDECEARRDGWLAAYLTQAADTSIGLIGEAMNEAWDRSWHQLAQERGQEKLPGHTLDGAPMPRVPLYLHHMRAWGVDPGATGRHLRSLAWFASRAVLERIGGFPIGGTYGACIAAEIAVSRKVEAAGLKLAQVAPEPFHYFSHADWKQAHAGGPFLHARSRTLAERLRRLWR